MKQITSCCFDLECTNLSADFGVLLCAAIKPAGRKAKVFRADKLSKLWYRRRSQDKELVQAVVDELSKYDIWIAHNGHRFDLPFLRTRLARWNLPPLPKKKLVDPVLLARNYFRLSFNSLDALARFLGVNRKTRIDPEVWLKASLDADKVAMDYIADHCVRDVKVLENVVSALKDYSSQLNSWGSGY